MSKLKWSKNYLKFWKKEEVKTFDFVDVYHFISFWAILFLLASLFKVAFYYLSGYLLSVSALVFVAGIFFGLVSKTKSTRMAHVAMGFFVAWFCDYFFQGII